MKLINLTIRRMTFEEADPEEPDHRGSIIEYEGKSYNLNAGPRYNTHVFTKRDRLYALSIDIQCHYVNLDTYIPPGQKPTNIILLHAEPWIIDALGRNRKELLPRTIITRLMNYSTKERMGYQP